MISYFHLEMSNYKKRHIHFLSDFAYDALHPHSKIKGMPRLELSMHTVALFLDQSL